MSGTDEADYTFVCPECEEELVVNTSMREALLARGCVVCGASLSAKAFSKDSDQGTNSVA